MLAVLQLGSTLVPLGLGEGPGEPLHLGAQLPHIPLQLRHLALPLRLAALKLQPQLMLALLQLLHRGGKIHVNLSWHSEIIMFVDDAHRQKDVKISYF